MSVIPKPIQDFLQFCEDHQDPWNTEATSIGLQSAAVTAWKAQVTSTIAAHDAAQQAIQSARAANVASRDQIASLRRKTADFVRLIKAFAENSANADAVYALAQIPPPREPGPVGPPGEPFEFRVELLGSGALQLRWKCTNPEGSTGTIYEIRRRGNTAGSNFVFVGASGTKTFLDETVPAGAAGAGGVTYQITAVRSTNRGNPAQFIVNFGIGNGGGLTVASVTPDNGVGSGGGMSLAA